MKKSRGFTLIEVLVAISLMALGLALAFATLRGATRATGRADIVSHRNEQLRAVQGFMRTQLNAALPIAFEFEKETGEATFLRVSPTRLEYVAVMPGYLARGGPYLQTLELVPGANGRQLVFTHKLLTPDGPIDAEREPVGLLDGIAEGSFKVRNIDAQSQPAPWQPKWEIPAQLPPLIGLDIRFNDPKRHWPEFVAATRLGIPFAGGAPVPLAGEPENAR